MTETVDTRQLLNQRELFTRAQCADLFKDQPESVVRIEAGKLYGMAFARAMRSDTVSGDSFNGLAGHFEMVRAVPRKVKAKGAAEAVPVAVITSRRLFMPNNIHDALDDLLYPDKATMDPAPIEFAGTVYYGRDGAWSVEWQHGPLPADPLAKVRDVHGIQAAEPAAEGSAKAGHGLRKGGNG